MLFSYSFGDLLKKKKRHHRHFKQWFKRLKLESINRCFLEAVWGIHYEGTLSNQTDLSKSEVSVSDYLSINGDFQSETV